MPIYLIGDNDKIQLNDLKLILQNISFYTAYL